MKNPQTTIAPTFLTHIISGIDGVFTVIGGKFKFQVQDSDLEYFFLEIWRF
jgi:hypothetical protein